MQTLDDDLATLHAMLAANKAALTVLARIADAVELERQQHASRELVRLGDIVRRGMSADEYLAAQRASQQAAPELWRNVQPMKPAGEKVFADEAQA